MILAAIAATGQADADALPNLFANRDEVTISGHSAGGHYSCHLMLTMSDTWKGAGCVKGGAFDLGIWTDLKADEITDHILEQLDELVTEDPNQIDSLDNLSSENVGSARRAIYVISGVNDHVVHPKYQKGTVDALVELGMNKTKDDDEQNLGISKKRDGHAFKRFYSGEILNFLWDKLDYGELERPGHKWWEDDSPGSFAAFDQKEFYPDSIDWEADWSFADRENGYIYIPDTCAGEASSDCRVHFALHGCFGDAGWFANNYNDIAMTNNIIMIYPDTTCWDGGGIIDPDNYKTNNGIVNQALLAMISRVTRVSDEVSASCEEYYTIFGEAQASLDSVREYLAGERDDWISFDPAQLTTALANAPDECELETKYSEPLT